ncbi:MAG: hypothetical protein A3E84_01795 [Gammaproteobacteria bacterium RIFCSPHIGHO2_12_FULL_42_13]|nr:MAG: hypothetical protein A3E84_01795 [Gammaproteobacteria bacterium RIFCSPHIGHO2_12_FULL_42_13]
MENEAKLPSTLKSVILPATVGNILEWYDFTLYGYFATIFAALYFPSHEKFLSLLAAYGLFAASYFMRPIGAIVFGYIGDMLGRKYSLAYSIILMGGSNLALSLLPTYANWGIMAGISLTILRLVQGFAVGGEYSGATIYLIESAKPERRTFFGSLALSSAYTGFLLSSAVGALLTAILTTEQLMSWGWRVGFGFGCLIALVGFYIRKKLRDTPAYRTFDKKTHGHHPNPLKDLFVDNYKTLYLALGIALLPAGFTYIIFVYLSNFLSQYANVSEQHILLINTICMLYVVITIPLIGILADKVGRKPLMIISAILIMIFCIPLLLLSLHYAFLALILMSTLHILYETNIPAEVAEMFPTSCRYTGLALTLNLTNGVAGGLAPVIASVLIYGTHMLISPMFYILALAIITIITLGIISKSS